MKIQKNNYVVKDILKYQVRDDQEYFLVWWEGFKKHQATWEPIENMIFLKDHQQFYQNLKKNYLQQKNNNKQHAQQLSNLQKAKKITKNPIKSKFQLQVKRHKQGPNKTSPTKQIINQQEKIYLDIKESHPINSFDSQVQGNISEGLSRQKLNLNTRSPITKIKSANKNQILLKQHLHPMPFQLKIKQSKIIPFWDQKLKNIKGAFYKDGKLMYEVQFQDNKCNQPIIVHQDYLKLLWPQKYYQYLQSKIKE